ncbi:hypothetical protein ACXN5S_08160 [Pseudoroseicyclus sp. H15]
MTSTHARSWGRSGAARAWSARAIDIVNVGEALTSMHHPTPALP